MKLIALLGLLFILTPQKSNAYYDSTIHEMGNLEEFLTLGEVVFEKAYYYQGKVKLGKLVQATNYSSDDVCVVSIIKESTNIKNEFFFAGKVILREGETLPLGGFESINRRKNWHASWRHIVKKDLSYCLE